MNLKIRDGQLTLGAVFKLTAISWLCFGGILCAIFMLLFVVTAVTGGEVMINGETIQGREVFSAMIPFLVLLPLIIAVQALVLGAFVTAGAALYRLRRPLAVTAETTTPASL